MDKRLTLPHVKMTPFTLRALVPYFHLLAVYEYSVTSIAQINVNHEIALAIVYTFYFPFIANGN